MRRGFYKQVTGLLEMSCPVFSLTLSPELSYGIQGVGLGFSSCTFLLRAAKSLISLPLSPPQQMLLNSTPWKRYLSSSASQRSLIDGNLLPLHIAPASFHSTLFPRGVEGVCPQDMQAGLASQGQW